MLLMLKVVALSLPVIVGCYVSYRLNRALVSDRKHLRMTHERRQLLIQADRNDPMKQMRGEELA